MRVTDSRRLPFDVCDDLLASGIVFLDQAVDAFVKVVFLTMLVKDLGCCCHEAPTQKDGNRNLRLLRHKSGGQDCPWRHDNQTELFNAIPELRRT